MSSWEQIVAPGSNGFPACTSRTCIRSQPWRGGEMRRSKTPVCFAKSVWLTVQAWCGCHRDGAQIPTLNWRSCSSSILTPGKDIPSARRGSLPCPREQQARFLESWASQPISHAGIAGRGDGVQIHEGELWSTWQVHVPAFVCVCVYRQGPELSACNFVPPAPVQLQGM